MVSWSRGMVSWSQGTRMRCLVPEGGNAEDDGQADKVRIAGDERQDLGIDNVRRQDLNSSYKQSTPQRANTPEI